MHRSIEQSESITKDLKKGKVERGSFGRSHVRATSS
jgi:hypothetical protein